MEFYEKLQKLRKENSMSQEELAEQLNVSRQAVSRWESGQGFPETEKLLQISNLYGVSLDYLLKSEKPVPEGATPEESGYYASREAVEGYLTTKRAGARRIALGVAVCILSLVFAMVLPYTWDGVMFFICIALGVGILVISSFRPKRYMELETQPLVFDPGYLREFRVAYMANRKKYGVGIFAGISCILLGLISVMVLNNIPGVPKNLTAVGFPIFIALGVALIIIAASADISEGLIAENEKHVTEMYEDKNCGWIYGLFMSLAAMVFLGIGFLTRAWHPAWLVFPVAAILATGIVNWKKSRE